MEGNKLKALALQSCPCATQLEYQAKVDQLMAWIPMLRTLLTSEYVQWVITAVGPLILPLLQLIWNNCCSKKLSKKKRSCKRRGYSWRKHYCKVARKHKSSLVAWIDEH